MTYFNQENTNELSNDDLALMNNAVSMLLHGSNDEDDIANACYLVNNRFIVDGENSLETLTCLNIKYPQLLSRHQAIGYVGEFNVNLVDKTDCEFSNREMVDETIEFTASVYVKDYSGDEFLLTAYYYQNKKDVTEHELDELKWVVAGYSIT